MTRETASLCFAVYLVHKVTLPRPRYVAALPNTWKQHRKLAKMRTQRNTSQMKDQNRNPEKGLNNTEIRNLLDAKLKAKVIKMLNNLSNKDIGNRKWRKETEERTSKK